jgi:hypothetical protein
MLGSMATGICQAWVGFEVTLDLLSEGSPDHAERISDHDQVSPRIVFYLFVPASLTKLDFETVF